MGAQVFVLVCDVVIGVFALLMVGIVVWKGSGEWWGWAAGFVFGCIFGKAMADVKRGLNR